MVLKNLKMSYSVDAINANKAREVEDQMQSVAQENARKMSSKSMDFNLKKVAQEKERLIKMSEVRVSRIIQMKIERRFGAFPWLKDKIPPLSNKPSLGELQETDDLQKLELDLQGAEKRLISYLTQGSMFLEGVWGDGHQMSFLPQHLRFNLTGISKIINSPVFMKEAEPLIMETVIEYPTLGQMSLPLRWGQCILQAMIMTHQMNTNPAFRKLVEKHTMGPQEEKKEEEEEFEETPTTTTYASVKTAIPSAKAK